MSTEQIPISRMDSTHVGTQRLLIEVADILGHKWHPVILHRLMDTGSLTFSGLQSGIDDISNKMLSDSLSMLEARGLVDREVVNEKPVRVRYALTDRGRELEAVLDPMVRWAREHLANRAVDTGGSTPEVRSRAADRPEGGSDE